MLRLNKLLKIRAANSYLENYNVTITHFKRLDYRESFNAEASAQINLAKEERVLGTEIRLRLKLEVSVILKSSPPTPKKIDLLNIVQVTNSKKT